MVQKHHVGRFRLLVHDSGQLEVEDWRYAGQGVKDRPLSSEGSDYSSRGNNGSYMQFWGLLS